VPAILVTGDTSPERLKEVSHAGITILHKPVSPSELHELIQKLFAESEKPVVSEFVDLKSAAS